VIRHGQSVADIEERYEGRADFPLTELGIHQAHKAAKWIEQRFPPSNIITSPLRRASETAKIISNQLGIDVEIDDDLMEWNNGLLAGMLRSEADIKYPLPKGGRNHYDEYYQCESFIQFRARAERIWSKLMATNLLESNKRICIVSHGGMINMLFRSFLNLPLQTEVNLSTGDTGIHLWKVSNKDKTVLFSNFLGHLDNV
jgi:2,3-bisphosphoglycerate-dependent phosphoglycerate mutase